MRQDRYDAYDTCGGKFSTHKVPKWQGNHRDLMIDFLASYEEEGLSGEPGLVSS